MDELISIFVENYFSEEFQEDVEQLFNLIEFFEYKDAYSGFVDILTDETNQSKDDMKDRFVRELHAKADFMLAQHTLELVQEATLAQKIEILKALAHMQSLEDYTGLIGVLESLEPIEVQLATILSDTTTMDEATLMHLVKKFNPRMLELLKSYIYSKEQDAQKSAEPNRVLLNNFRTFSEVIGRNNVGVAMLANGMLPGQRFETYLAYIEDSILAEKDEVTAENFLSVIYLSHDGFNAPLLVYRKYSYRILQDLNRVSRVEVLILSMIAKLTEYKKAQDEKARLSQASA